MSEEISKHTIVILVVLTVVISFLGTWTVMHEVNKISVDNSEADAMATVNTGGQATITILEHPPKTQGQATIEIGS